jgi:hypothetical protein
VDCGDVVLCGVVELDDGDDERLVGGVDEAGGVNARTLGDKQTVVDVL